MPKQPGGISRLKRVEALMQVLSRWGLLDKVEIDHKVSMVLSVDKEKIERSLYRDLQELVDQGTIKMFGKSPDGRFFENMDHSESGKFKSYWCLPDYSPNEIIGVQKLRQLDGDFYCDSVLKNSFRVTDVPQKLDHFHGFIFSIGVQNLAITYDPDSIPFSLLITRSGVDLMKAKNELEQQEGIRIAILALPHDKISAYKPNKSLGHALIKFQDDHKISVQDLNSSNGTLLREVDKLNQDIIIKSFMERNKTKKENDFTVNDSKVLKKIDLKSTFQNKPFEVCFGKSFYVIVI